MKKKHNHRQNKNISATDKNNVKHDNEVKDDEIKEVAGKLEALNSELSLIHI